MFQYRPNRRPRRLRSTVRLMLVWFLAISGAAIVHAQSEGDVVTIRTEDGSIIRGVLVMPEDFGESVDGAIGEKVAETTARETANEQRARFAERKAYFTAMPYRDRILFGVQLSLVGFVIVMCVLALIAACTAGMARLDARYASKSPESPNPPISAHGMARVAGEGSEQAESLDDHSVALITAAVAAVIGGPFRVRSIHLQHGPTTWSSSGRQIIHASHALERK